jgi:hypothetical protein
VLLFLEIKHLLKSFSEINHVSVSIKLTTTVFLKAKAVPLHAMKAFAGEEE